MDIQLALLLFYSLKEMNVPPLDLQGKIGNNFCSGLCSQQRPLACTTTSSPIAGHPHSLCGYRHLCGWPDSQGLLFFFSCENSGGFFPPSPELKKSLVGCRGAKQACGGSSKWREDLRKGRWCFLILVLTTTKMKSIVTLYSCVSHCLHCLCFWLKSQFSISLWIILVSQVDTIFACWLITYPLKLTISLPLS